MIEMRVIDNEENNTYPAYRVLIDTHSLCSQQAVLLNNTPVELLEGHHIF